MHQTIAPSCATMDLIPKKRDGFRPTTRQPSNHRLRDFDFARPRKVAALERRYRRLDWLAGHRGPIESALRICAGLTTCLATLAFGIGESSMAMLGLLISGTTWLIVDTALENWFDRGLGDQMHRLEAEMSSLKEAHQALTDQPHS